jgi:hypothetical protein
MTAMGDFIFGDASRIRQALPHVQCSNLSENGFHGFWSSYTTVLTSEPVDSNNATDTGVPVSLRWNPVSMKKIVEWDQSLCIHVSMSSNHSGVSRWNAERGRWNRQGNMTFGRKMFLAADGRSANATDEIDLLQATWNNND